MGACVQPFLLRFAATVQPFPLPEDFRYDPATQVGRSGDAIVSATQRGRSYQNSTTSYGLVTGYEDYDDEYVVETD